MRALTLIFLFVILAFACDQAEAQAGVKRAAASPYEQQFEIQFTSNSNVVIDKSTRRVYVTGPDGNVFDFSFEQAAAAAETDPTKRQALINALETSLVDPQHMVTIAPPRVATDTTLWPKQYCGEFACIDPYSTTRETEYLTMQYKSSSASDCNHFLCPRMPFPCDMGPCSPRQWGDGNFFYTGNGAGWGDDQGGGTVTQQDLVALDRQLWERERVQACNDKDVYMTTTIATGAATVAACFATPFTGIAALGCAGGSIAYAVGVYQTDQAAERCYASYPGYGNW